MRSFRATETFQQVDESSERRFEAMTRGSQYTFDSSRSGSNFWTLGLRRSSRDPARAIGLDQPVGRWFEARIKVLTFLKDFDQPQVFDTEPRAHRPETTLTDTERFQSPGSAKEN